MTKSNILMLMLSVLSFSMTGCGDDDNCNCCTGQGDAQPLVLQGQAYTFNTEEGVVWHNAQEIGVFLTETGLETVADDYVNLRYYADNRNSYGYFVPNGAPVYLDGEQTLDVKAYYPYKDVGSLTQGKGVSLQARDTEHYIYDVDLSNQKTAKPDAFLYADNARRVSKISNKANLELRPVLSRVSITLVPGADVTEEMLRTLKVYLKGMSATAQFDLLKGDFLDAFQSGGDTKIALEVKSDLAITIVMFPEELSKNATLEITLPADGDNDEKTMSWSLNNVVEELEKNTQYFVMLKVGQDGVTGELTGQSLIYIQDWGYSDDVDGSATPD